MKALRIARILDELRQIEVCRKARLNPGVYSQIESGLIEPSPRQLEKIRRALPSFDRAVQILKEMGNQK